MIPRMHRIEGYGPLYRRFESINGGLAIGIGGNLTVPPSHTTGHTAPAVGAGVRVRIRRFGKRQDIC
jgi:hypothetical protein